MIAIILLAILGSGILVTSCISMLGILTIKKGIDSLPDKQ